ncbi:MAG: CinA family nicotinamide mononucleotide deamidase-related protein [Thermodesulfobacteriota bacterium]|nr:CinA family nicotinamide mononucleotide deamidase-related protein [Thermodesulfobacteriota bacterium]
MKAEILSTGNEILSGSVTDTNSSWLAVKLLETGIRITRQTCTGDETEGIATAIKEISNRADIVLVTGGLGPTIDDVTAKAAALAAGDKLDLNQKALLSIKAYFEQKSRHMPEINRKQANLPLKSVTMENSCGTAPGFHMEIGKALFFFMPGVPFEMKKMFKTGVVPEIEKRFGVQNQLFSESFTVFGLPEAEVGTRLRGFHEKFSGFRLGFRAAFPLIEVKFSCQGMNTADEKAENAMKQAGQWIFSRLDKRVVSLQGLLMEQEVGRLLSLSKATIAVAESCTGGLIANMLTDVPGSSDYFLLSAVTYSNRAKIEVLGVNQDTIIKNGAVHRETAREMAEGARRIAKADYGISTSGVAGPGGGSDDKPVGTVCIGVAGPGFSKGKQYYFPFIERGMNKKIFAVTALELLRRELIMTL